MKWIKITPTRTDSAGNGYYRGEDGVMRYGNPKNGYMRLTLEEQEKRRQAEAAKQTEAEREAKMEERHRFMDRQNAASAALGKDYSRLVVTGFVGSLLAVMIYLLLFGAVVSSLITLWPNYIRTLISDYSCMIFSASYRMKYLLIALLHTVHVVAAFSLLVHCFSRMSPEESIGWQASFFFKRFFAISVVIGVLSNVVEGRFELIPSIVESVVLGFGYTILPTLLLYYWAYHISGRKRFFHHLAGVLCDRVPGRGKPFIIMGVLTLIFDALFVISKVGTYSTWLSADTTVFLMFGFIGVFSIYFGKIGD